MAVPASVTTNVSLQPPERFDFKQPDGWLKWRRRFEQFLSASGLDSKEDARKISTLLYCLGDEAEDVLTSTNITVEERRVYQNVMDKLNGFFSVRKNVIYERARFNKRDQREGESAETYIMELYRLAETCDYGDMKEQMLRDRLVVGIRDMKLSESLQMDASLKLEKAKKTIRQKEAVHEQRQTLQEAGGPPLNEIFKSGKQHGHKRKPFHKGGGSHGASVPVYKNTSTSNQSCMRCGKDRHPTPDKCPAHKATCFKCNRKGHYGSQCLSKTKAPASTHEVEADLDSAFLGTVNATSGPVWLSKVKVDNKVVQFKLDTGAEVSVISDQVFSTLGRVKLEKPSRVLYGPARHPLKVLGQFTGKLSYGQRFARERIFVVEGLQNCLLGLPAIISLKLAQRVDTATSTPDRTIQEQFPKVFKGLGTIGGGSTPSN